MSVFTSFPSMLRTLLLGAVAALPVLAAPAGQDEDPTPAEAVGALRHVQLLEVTDGDAPVVRFVTAMRRGADGRGLGRLALFECPIEDVIDLGDPVETLDLPFEVLPAWTWMTRVPWRVVEGESKSWLIAHDVHGWVAEIRAFPSGETLIRIGGTRSLEDVRLRGDVIEILGCAGRGVGGEQNQPTQVERIRWTIGSDEAVRESLLEVSYVGNAPQHAPVATFARGSVGAAATDTVVIAEMRGRAPVFHVLAGGSAETRTLTPTLDNPDSSPMRLRVWEQGGLRRIALGLPRWDGGLGRVLVMADDEGKPAHLLVNHLTVDAESRPSARSSPTYLMGGHHRVRE